MRRIQRRIPIIAVLLIVALVGCASFTSNSSKVLTTAGTAYNATFLSLADLHRQGKLTDADRDNAIAAGKKFWSAYHEAVTALEIYQVTKTDANKDKVSAALIHVGEKLGDVQGYLNLEGGGK